MSGPVIYLSHPSSLPMQYRLPLLIHQHFVDSDCILKSFPTARRLEKREIKGTPDYEILLV